MALAVNRLELFGIELREEQERFLKLLLVGLLSILLLAGAVVLFLVALLLFVEPSLRPWVSLACGAFFLLCAVICWFLLQKSLASGDAPFVVTRQELKKDCGIS